MSISYFAATGPLGSSKWKGPGRCFQQMEGAGAVL